MEVIEALPSGRWGLVVEDEYSLADDGAHTMRLGGAAVRARQEVSESKRWPPSTSPCRFSRRAELHDPTKRLLRYSG